MNKMDIEEPIGGILLRNNIPCVHAEDGAYYHYSNVCTALEIAKQEGKQSRDKEIIEKLKRLVTLISGKARDTRTGEIESIRSFIKELEENLSK
jgi:hypothetical protein